MIQDEPEVPDAQLVHAVLNGDSESFGCLFDRYYDMIHDYAYRARLGESDADDIAQETFIRAARGIASYRGRASFKNWLFRIAHNVIFDWTHKNTEERNKQEEFSAELLTQESTNAPDFSEIHVALNQLPSELRETIALVFFGEMNHRQVADVLGCAETTVSWRIFHAKRALRKLLRTKREILR